VSPNDALKLTVGRLARLRARPQLIWNDRCQAYRERVVAVSVVSVSSEHTLTLSSSGIEDDGEGRTLRRRVILICAGCA
jgi:hypothetical protein